MIAEASIWDQCTNFQRDNIDTQRHRHMLVDDGWLGFFQIEIISDNFE